MISRSILNPENRRIRINSISKSIRVSTYFIHLNIITNYTIHSALNIVVHYVSSSLLCHNFNAMTVRHILDFIANSACAEHN